MTATADRTHRRARELVPGISPRLVRLFVRYSRNYVRKHFHSVRVLKSHVVPGDFSGLPVVVFINHSSWWDPLICLILAATEFPRRDAFGPIDARALDRYRFLSRLGFFGVRADDARDVVSFLQTATAILASAERMIWVTPQGRFADVRTRPVLIQRGLAHIAARVESAVFLPVAIEYSFWEERKPEVLIAWGHPIFSKNHRDHCGVEDWTGVFEKTLQDTQDALAAAAQRRQADEWTTLLRGGSGTTAIYDSWRWLRARISGQKFTRSHSDL